MIIQYDRGADVLLIKLRNEPPVDAVEDEGGVIVSYGRGHVPVSVEFLNASGHGLVQSRDPQVTLVGLRAHG